MSDKSSSVTIPERGERLTCNIANLMNPYVSDHKRTSINYSRFRVKCLITFISLSAI